MKSLRYSLLSLIPICLLLINSKAFSQNTNWVQSIHQASKTIPSKLNSPLIHIDGNENIIVCGDINGTSSFGAQSISGNGFFIAKYKKDQTLLWVKKVTGTNGVFASDIKTDNNGNIFICGGFSGTAEFGGNSITSTSIGEHDAFVSKFNSEGANLWAMNFGGNYRDYAYGIDLDSLNNCYIVGSSQLQGASSFDIYDSIFLKKISENGDTVWTKYAGRFGNANIAYSVAIKNSKMYLSGQCTGGATFGSITLSGTTADIYDFIASYDLDGNAVWAKEFKLGCSDPYYKPNCITTDSTGNIYFSGLFSGSAADFEVATLYPKSKDIFITKLDDRGSVLWAKAITGYDSEKWMAKISSGANETVYLVGYFCGTIYIENDSLTNYDTTVWVPDGDDNTKRDIFAICYNASGDVLWKKKAGGLLLDEGTSIDYSNKALFLTGYFQGAAQFDSFNKYTDQQDIFFIKIDNSNVKDLSLTLNAPNGGENWQTGSTHNITWTSSYVDSIMIEYSTDNGISWSTVVASVPASTGSYTWTIPNTTSPNSKIKISSTNTNTLADTSNSTFLIYNSSLQIGLIAYYPFNGNANDESGNGNNGTVSNTSLSTDRFGAINHAYQFNGTNSYITVPHSDALNFTGKKEFTLCAWVKKTGIGNGDPRLLTKGDDGGYQLTISPNSQTGYFFGGGGAPGFYSHTPVSNYWNFIVGVRSATQCLIYVNGKLDTTVTATGDNAVSNDNLTFGKKSGSNFDYFQGMLDDIRIYNRALSSSEIDTIYNEGGWGTIALHSPNGGERWRAGTLKKINWIAIGTTKVKLSYSTNSGTDWIIIADSINASDTTYEWTLPYISSQLCRVKITDVNDSLHYNISNMNFNIYIPEMIAVSKSPSATGSVTTTFDSTNVQLSLFVKVITPISVLYYPSEPPIYSGLPSDVKVISQYYWTIAASGIYFLNGEISVALTDLKGIYDVAKLVWLKRKNADTLWSNIGGVILNGRLKNTIQFSSFGEFAIGSTDSANTLPVELTSFTASLKSNRVVLTWSTATENNNVGFEIERSKYLAAQGTTLAWGKIGFVSGAGNSFSPKEYKYIDNSVAFGKYLYRLKQIDNDGKSSYSKTEIVDLGNPKEFRLYQSYPNPFNPDTKITYQIPEDAHVKLEVYNISGEKMAILVDENQEAGNYNVEITPVVASCWPSGVYIYRITASGLMKEVRFCAMKKMVLMK